ncbi:MAG: AAA family ATPase [Gammaproteobacteria bacterium]
MSIIQQAVDKLARARLNEADDPRANGKDRSGTTVGIFSGPDNRRGMAASEIQRHRIVVDRKKLTDVGLLVPEEFERQTTAEFRRIKRPLLRNAFGAGAATMRRGNLIVVTSALPGTGKTFTTLNLALTMARERDLSVLLVDGDVAKPHLSHMLGLHRQAGLLDYLARDAAVIEDFIVDTDVPGLAVLPAGKPHPEATELLSSPRMQDLVERLARHRDRWIVLFDSPPLLVTTESQVLTGLMEQIVLVVEADSSPRPAVQQAIDLLDSSKAINLVLNKTQRGFMDRYDGYYGANYEDDAQD